MTVTDYPDWQTPQAHATAISITGAPLLRLTNNLGSGSAVTIAGGATDTFLVATSVNQPGYELTVQAYMPASSGTVPFLHVQMIWYDATLGIKIAKRDVVMACGNAVGNVLTYYMRGPMHGDKMMITCQNLDPAVTATVTWSANATSHVYEQDGAIQYGYTGTAPNGYLWPAGVPTANLIAYESASIAASGSESFLCALYAGDVILNVENITSAQNVKIELFDSPGYITGTAGSPFFGVDVAGGSSDSLQLTLPYSPVTLKATNLSTALAATPVISLVGQQH